MNKEIKELLNNLENWKENFEIKEYYNINTEISKIINFQLKKDLNPLLELWNKKLEKEYFELEHPENELVVTRAVKNIQFGMANFIFMIDKDNKYPWIFGQCEGFIDLIITKNNIYKTSLSNDGPIKSQIHKLIDINPNDIYYKGIKYGFLLSQTRPYHYFYDHLKYLNYFKQNKKTKKTICYDKAFFELENNIKDTKNKVFLFPSIIGFNQLRNDQITELNKQMEKEVYNEAIKSLEEKVNKEELKNYDLILWYGITGQKRSWLEQIEGFEQIINKLKQSFPKIKVYVDGMTASDGEIIENKEDEEVYEKLKKPFENDENINITSLIGQDYRTKICYCSISDIFIANGGTGCMVPLKFCEKPGVLHSNTSLWTFGRIDTNLIKSTDNKNTFDSKIDEKTASMAISYHIPWQYIYNLTAEVLEQIKDIKINRLDVPDVKEIAEKYEKQEKENIFNNIDKKINANSKSPDILRDVAVAFEQSGDIQTALKLMQKAQDLRPTGPFIKRKVIEYKEILSKK